MPTQSYLEITVENVAEALRRVKQGKLERLGESELGSLVKDCRLTTEPDTAALQGFLLYHLLHWAVEQLRPTEEESLTIEERWRDEGWRLYNVLYYPYFTELTFATVARRMDVDEPAIYKKQKGLRPRALGEVTVLLQRAEWLKDFQLYLHHIRWESLTDEAHLLLTHAAQLRTPFSPKLLYECAGVPAPSPELLADLCSAGLLQKNERHDTFTMDPSFRAYIVRDKLSSGGKEAGHKLALSYHQASPRTNYLEVAYHLCHLCTVDGRAETERAASLLIEQREQVVREHTWQELTEVLGLFKRDDLPDHLWFQVKLLEGDAALAAGEVPGAIDLYLDEIYTKADRNLEVELVAAAAHRLGKAYRRVDPQMAQHYYKDCSDLLRTIPTPSPLLVPIFVDQAWSFIQENKELAEAERLLRLAQQFIEQRGTDQALEARLHNAWAGYYVHRKQVKKVLWHRGLALLAAQKAQDREFEAMIAKNLGFDYAQLQGRYDVAFHFVKRALTLTVQAGERQLEGLCLKDLGNCCFWREDYAQAIAYYKEAYAIFEEGKNKNWLAAACLDLTEAHAEEDDSESAWFYFKQGRALAEELGHSDYLAFVDDLITRYPTLRILDLEFKVHQEWAEGGNNKDWLAAACLELTKAYAELHDGEKARGYFKQGRALAEELGHANYLAFVGYLQRQYPNLCALDLALNARQVWALDYVAEHGSINYSIHHEQHKERSRKTAQRDLKDLCDKNLFEAVGKARATVYRFAEPPEPAPEASGV